MAFKDLKLESEFMKLDSQREAVLACLDGLKDAVDALPKDKLSMRQFSKLETNIENEIANLQTLEKEIAV